MIGDRYGAPSDLDGIALQVLTRFALAQPGLGLASQGNAGGFSGARLWRAKSLAGDVCLRAWPSEAIASSRLQWIHDLMRSARGAGLDFVPRLFQTSAGATWISAAGRLWEATSWMPGRANYHDHPSPERLEAACGALAALHRVWGSINSTKGACPAVGRRLARFDEWKALLASGWRPDFGDSRDSIAPTARRSWAVLLRRADRIPNDLSEWADQHMRLQPCLCDVWHDHVLFEGDTVSGVVDYGGVKVDHVAIDLARLLGSLVEDDSEARAIGLRAYGRGLRLSDDEVRLVDVLDRTGILLGLANWLIWLYKEHRAFDDRRAVARRLEQLVQRVERWE
jgi:Ser/Thr protein kinase RdoA (MazF antagonist)